MKIESDFAIIDVKRGRKALSRLMPQGSLSLAECDRIPVTIHGYIFCQHGADDGVSIEFGVDVERVEVVQLDQQE